MTQRQGLSTADIPTNQGSPQDAAPQRQQGEAPYQDQYSLTNGHPPNGHVIQDRLGANRNSPYNPESNRRTIQDHSAQREANGHVTQDLSDHRLAGRGLYEERVPDPVSTSDLNEDSITSHILTRDLYEDALPGGLVTRDIYEGRVANSTTEADLMMGEEGQTDRHKHRGPTGQGNQGTCCSRCRSEFRLRNFSLSHPNPDLFYSCQWQWPPVVFLLYRFLVAGYVLAWLVITAVNFPKELRFPWPVWLTNWSYLLLTCHLVLALVIAVVHYGSRRGRGSRSCCRRSSSYSSQDWHGEPRRSTSGILSDSSTTEGAVTGSSSEFTVDFEQLPDALPWYVKLDWLLFATVSNISFIVSLVYFVALYPQLVNVDGAPPLIEDLHLHLVNSVVVLLEVGVSALPIRLLHALYPLSYGLIYIIFSAIYWGVDHTNVLYPEVLDWNTPGRTIAVVLVLALVFVPVFQLFVFGLYRLRLALHGRTSRWGQ